MTGYVGDIRCGTCGQLLIVDMAAGRVPSILFCVQSDCERYNVRYYAPTVQLIPVSE